jgi:hypothetical protein
MLESVTVGVRDGRVWLVNNVIKKAIGFSWRAALACGQSLCYKARGARGPEREEFSSVFVRRDDDRILLAEISGQTFMVAPLEGAARLGAAMIYLAHELEEKENAQAVAFDQAILQRSGARFGLTSDPKIQAEAGKEAAWNSDLRRYIPPTKLRQQQVGRPWARHRKVAK